MRRATNRLIATLAIKPDGKAHPYVTSTNHALRSRGRGCRLRRSGARTRLQGAGLEGMSGLFVISENGEGFIEQTTPCVAPYMEKARRTVDFPTRYLCSTGGSDPTSRNYQKTMDSTWANPAITGVFIRLKWSDIQTGPTTYSSTAIRRLLGEVDKAVANGKAYSIAIKSGAENDATPAWLFEPAPAGAGLTPVILDWNEGSASTMRAGSTAMMSRLPTWAWGRSRTFPICRCTHLTQTAHCRGRVMVHSPSAGMVSARDARTSGRPTLGQSAG